MEKKLYYKLSDGADVSGIVMELSGVMEWIESDMRGVPEEDLKEFEYTIQPVMMTEEEFNNLPEANI